MDRSEFIESNGKGNGSFRSGLNRQMISLRRSTIDESLEKQKQQKIKNFNTYGNGKYINVGASDRLLGNPFQIPESAVSTADIQSYYYGYYQKANMNLKIYCNGAIPDYLKSEFYNTFNLNPETDSLTREQIMLRINQILIKIGYQDSQNEEISYEDLPEDIKNNEYYNLGYNAKLNEKPKGKR